VFAELGVRDTVNVAWLVGATSHPNQPQPQPLSRPKDPLLGSSHPYVRQYIDIFEHSQPPSHLAVKEANEDADDTVESFAASGGVDVDSACLQSHRAYTLSRSKSACDLAYANLVAAASMPPADETQSEAVTPVAKEDKATLTRLSSSSSSSRRNRTILGSFPLFYKLSQHQPDGSPGCSGNAADAADAAGAGGVGGTGAGISPGVPPANSHHQRKEEDANSVQSR